jgi:hypothetical protein
MRTLRLFLFVALCMAPAAQASIIGVDCAPLSGGVTVDDYSWDQAAVNLSETLRQGPGAVYAEITLDTNPDPTIWLRKTVSNDTGFAWTGYQIDISLPQTFTIDAVSGPASWTVIAGTPQLVGSKYVSTIQYTWGGSSTEVPVGGTGEFDIQVTFTGTNRFCLEQTATPEPLSLAMLALGGVLMGRFRRQQLI